MPIDDEFRTIAEQANRDLDAAHDFFEHSQVVWQSFQLLVNSGHTVSSVNSATGTTIDQAGLLRLAPRYTRDYLATFTFRHFVSAFETFFFAFFHRVLRHNPWPFGKTQLDFETVLKARDRDEIIGFVLLKQINELKYEKVRDWFLALNKAIRLDCPTEEEIDFLAEIKTTRDILEHNAGMANEVYVRKSGKKARYIAGEYIEIDDGYLLASWQLIKKLVTDLTSVAIAKLGP